MAFSFEIIVDSHAIVRNNTARPCDALYPVSPKGNIL